MELCELRSTHFWVLLGVLTAWCGVIVLARKKQRLPNVEFLRICDKPGNAGDDDDVEAFMEDSLGAILKGYKKYSKAGRHFLLRTPKQVYLMISPTMLDEIRKAPETHLSQPAQAEIIFQVKHTLHPALSKDLYHFNVVRKKLTHALPSIITNLVDETLYALDVAVGTPLDWVELQMYPVASNLITRVANRMLVGSELCRNDEFLHYSGAFTKATFDAAAMLRNVPEIIKPLMMRFRTDHREQQEIARKYLIPIINERIKAIESGTTEKRKLPNDSVTWLLELTPAEKRDPEILLQRLIHINVTAIHAPVATLTECMYDLCRYPEIHEELRSEIAEVFANKTPESAWTKANVDRLIKLDSFIRESARMTPMSAGEKCCFLSILQFLFVALC